MKRRDLVKRAESLGFYRLRKAKHADLYRHRYTSKVVGIPHTPSDNRSLDNTLADLRRAAGNGGDTTNPVDEVKRILGTGRGEVMMPRRTKSIVQESTLPETAVRPAVPRVAREEGYVKLGRGWYVYDPYLDSLTDKAKKWACEEIIRQGPAKVYRNTSVRESVIREATAMAAKAQQMADRELMESFEAAVEAKTEEEQQQLPAAPLCEMVADDGDGTAIFRGEDGRLWVAYLLDRRYRGGD